LPRYRSSCPPYGTIFSNLFANIGGFTCVYALGAIRDTTGSFAWSFMGIGGLCLAGMALAFVLARMRRRALGAARRTRTVPLNA